MFSEKIITLSTCFRNRENSIQKASFLANNDDLHLLRKYCPLIENEAFYLGNSLPSNSKPSNNKPSNNKPSNNKPSNSELPEIQLDTSDIFDWFTDKKASKYLIPDQSISSAFTLCLQLILYRAKFERSVKEEIKEMSEDDDREETVLRIVSKLYNLRNTGGSPVCKKCNPDRPTPGWMRFWKSHLSSHSHIYMIHWCFFKWLYILGIKLHTDDNNSLRHYLSLISWPPYIHETMALTESSQHRSRRNIESFIARQMNLVNFDTGNCWKKETKTEFMVPISSFNTQDIKSHDNMFYLFYPVLCPDTPGDQKQECTRL